MVSNLYNPVVTITGVLMSFATAVLLARLGGIPGPVLAVPGVVLAFMLSRRPSGEPIPEKLAAAALFSVLAGASTWGGAQMPRHPVVSGAVFVVLAGGSIWARRFGPAATRLGVMVPFALIACLLASRITSGDAPWWPGCGWAALVGLGAFCWVRAARRLGARITGIASITGSTVRPAGPRRRSAHGGMSTSTRMALQMALALTIALIVGHLLFGVHWQWCVMSAMVVNVGTVGRGELALKGIERGLGAMAGTVLAALLEVVAEPHGVACIAVIFAVLAVASGLRQHSYACYAAGITMAMSLLFQYFGESAQHLLVIRLQALALGAVIAIAVGWFLLPVRAVTALRARLAAALAALSTLLEARRAGTDASTALAVFDAAAADVHSSTRPHRLHRTALRLTRGRGPRIEHPADVGEALLSARASVHALSVTAPDPHERATATALSLLRRALADPAAPLPDLPGPCRQGPLADLDAALRQLGVAIPTLGPRTAHAVPAEARVTQPGR